MYWCGKDGELWEQLRLTVSPNYGVTSLCNCVVVREGLVLLPMHHHTLVCWTFVRGLIDDLNVCKFVVLSYSLWLYHVSKYF